MRLLACAISCLIFPNAIAKAQTPVSTQLLAQRHSILDGLLSAIKRGDQAAIARSGAAGVPYFVGYDQPKRQSASPFSVRSLTPFAACAAASRGGGGNWVSVQWHCPSTVSMPWPSTMTAFKFDGSTIVEIRTAPGVPTYFFPNGDPLQVT